MRFFKICIYLFIAIAAITGINDLIGGLAAMTSFETTIPEEHLKDPVADNVFRFFAGLWFGRVLSIVQYGYPEGSGGMVVAAGLFAELFLSPILLVWLWGKRDVSQAG